MWAKSATATATAVTLKPLSMVKLGDLDFGRIAAGTATGTVAVDASTDARAATGGAVALGGTPLAARFVTYAAANSMLQVTRGALPVLTRVGGGATMSVTGLTLNGATARIVSPAGLLDLRVGATLAVAANQADGSYAGTFDIIVTYF